MEPIILSMMMMDDDDDNSVMTRVQRSIHVCHDTSVV